VRPSHAGGLLAEPAPAVLPLPDSLEVFRRPPVACTDLHRGASNCIPRSIQAGFLWRRRQYFGSAMVSWVVMPLLLGLTEPVRNPEFQVDQRGDLRPRLLFGGFAS